jgi:glutamate synthase domain-containing protein 3
VVLNLGGFGVNIGSGMTGGIIYFVDADEKEVVQKTNSDYLSHSKMLKSPDIRPIINPMRRHGMLEPMTRKK